MNKRSATFVIGVHLRQQFAGFRFRRESTAAACFAVALFACLLYANSIVNGFRADTRESIRHGAEGLDTDCDAWGLVIAAARVNDYYRPLPFSIFARLYHVAGPNPLPFHLLQIALHRLNCALVLLIARAVWSNRSLEMPLIGAALFRFASQHHKLALRSRPQTGEKMKSANVASGPAVPFPSPAPHPGRLSQFLYRLQRLGVNGTSSTNIPS